MFFNNIRLYIDDQNTGRLKVKFVCKKCSKEMDEVGYWFCPCSKSGTPLYHEAEFMCNECGSKTVFDG